MRSPQGESFEQTCILSRSFRSVEPGYNIRISRFLLFIEVFGVKERKTLKTPLIKMENSEEEL